jgi:hypothetical protein
MAKRAVILSVAVALLVASPWGMQAFAAVDCGAPVAAPKHQAGEKWAWKAENGATWSESVQADGDMTQMKEANGDVIYHNDDWVIRKVVRSDSGLTARKGVWQADAGQKIINFPLRVGDKWEYSFFAPSRAGRGNLVTFWHEFKVLGCEEVTTPAGTFPAVKISMREGSTESYVSGQGGPTTMNSFVWYAPQVKNIVKREYAHDWWGVPGVNNFELASFEVK